MLSLRGQREHAACDRELHPGCDDVHVIGFCGNAVLRIENGHLRASSNQIPQDACVAGGKVLDNHERKTAMDRYMGEELLKRLQTARRTTNADDWEHAKSTRWPYLLRCTIDCIGHRCRRL
jgi:hypothetical protein